jgi:hypothetical protein
VFGSPASDIRISAVPVPKLAHRDEVVFAESVRPAREAGAQPLQHERPHVEFDGMPLSVVEPDRLDLAVAVERPREAGGGVLSAGEQHEGPRMHAGSVGPGLRAA